MWKFAFIAIVAAISAVGAAQAFVALDKGQGAAPAANVAVAEERPPAPAPQPASYDASISKSPDGHYWAEADVDGHDLRLLVDTGATAVALTSDDARRLGIDPNTLDYAYSVATANGQAKAAHVKLASVSVAGARVNDVDAFVLDHGLETSLLGMTYLGRLSKFEATQTSLILRP